MAKKRRPRPAPMPPRPRRRPSSREFRLQMAVVAAFVVLLAIIGGVIGYAFYEAQLGPGGSTALQVGETSFNLDYFTRRLKLLLTETGLQGQSEQAQLAIALAIDRLQRDEVLRQRAPLELGLSVSPQEIDAEIATRLNVSQDDPQALAAAYEGELERVDLSDEEYRRMIEAELLSRRAQETFTNSVPQTMEQVRLRQILVGTEEEARSVVERLAAGEDFGQLARELSLDGATKEKGGERDWLARDELDLSYAAKVFALEIGRPSEPIPAPGGYFVFEVLEKESARELTPEQRTTISSAYFSLWVDEQGTLLSTTEYVFGDSEKYWWAVRRAFGL